ncbi:hypothetical protein [Streptomyces sp. NPDC085665]|uniref:hypothetical protein n=1 Tax=Streptomyces sp. NPDC085665 TaxID=3365735 RepID=UPI0037D1229B
MGAGSAEGLSGLLRPAGDGLPLLQQPAVFEFGAEGGGQGSPPGDPVRAGLPQALPLPADPGTGLAQRPAPQVEESGLLLGCGLPADLGTLLRGDEDIEPVEVLVFGVSSPVVRRFVFCRVLSAVTCRFVVMWLLF